MNFFTDPEKNGTINELIDKEKKNLKQLETVSKNAKDAKPSSVEFEEDVPYVPTPSSLGNV